MRLSYCRSSQPVIDSPSQSHFRQFFRKYHFHSETIEIAHGSKEIFRGFAEIAGGGEDDLPLRWKFGVAVFERENCDVVGVVVREVDRPKQERRTRGVM